MSKVIILQQVDFEGPGRLVPVMRDFGMKTEIRRLYRGDEVPTDLDELRVLIALGGPMGIADVGGEKYPFLAQEVELLKRMIAIDKPVLGICLGAQLLAFAGGAKVQPNLKMAPPAKPHEPPKPADPPVPLPELGWGGVTFPFPGGTEPIVMGLMDGAPMFHWHFDTFDLPRLPAPANPAPPPAPPPPTGNSLLSSTRLCKNQAFRFKTKLFGFQYHFEFTPKDIDAVLANAGQADRLALGSDGISKINADTQKLYPLHERLGNRIIRNFVQFLKVY